MTRKLSAFAFVTAIAGSAAGADAEPDPTGIEPAAEARTANSEEARAEFERGLEALRNEQWPEAELHFRRSLELVPRPSTTYNLAYVLFERGRHQESLALLEALERDQTPGADRYREFAAQLLPRVLAEVEPPRSGVAPATRVVEAPPVASSPLTRPASTPVAPWVMVGTGGALLIAGAVTGLLALDADHDLEQQCPTNQGCDPSLESTRNRAQHLGTATDVLLITGGVLVAGGLTWRILLPSPGAGRDAAFVSVAGSM